MVALTYHPIKPTAGSHGAVIIAKVHRDEMIRRGDPVYPACDLASNKGSRSPRHLAALWEHGPAPLHRLSFAQAWMSSVRQEAFGFMADDKEELPEQAIEMWVRALPSNRGRTCSKALC